MSTRAITYWITTGLLCLALLVTGSGKLVRAEAVVQSFGHLGYPTYLLSILGFWYVAAAVALAVPGWVRIKEWAYAGVFFAMTGGAASHGLNGDGFASTLQALFLAALAVASYLSCPAERRLLAGGHAPASAG